MHQGLESIPTQTKSIYLVQQLLGSKPTPTPATLSFAPTLSLSLAFALPLSLSPPPLLTPQAEEARAELEEGRQMARERVGALDDALEFEQVSPSLSS